MRVFAFHRSGVIGALVQYSVISQCEHSATHALVGHHRQLFIFCVHSIMLCLLVRAVITNQRRHYRLATIIPLTLLYCASLDISLQNQMSRICLVGQLSISQTLTGHDRVE